MGEAALHIANLHKNYGPAAVLEGVDLRLEPGGFCGLVGVNGAGKTTLLKCVLDFCDFQQGAVSVFGIPSGQPLARRRLTYLPERFMPPYYLTGADFLRCMAELQGREYSLEQCGALARALDLEPAALLKPVRQLSKGMSQKLGLLACLQGERDLMVLDEPMSGLDPKGRARLRSLLLDLRAAGRTVLFSTHLLGDVEALCTQVAVLHEGRIRFSGTPQECCREYGAVGLEQAYLQCIDSEPPTG